MISITIRKLDAALKEQPRGRAARQGHSMEAEVRHIL
jgi:plasmid stability protein